MSLFSPKFIRAIFTLCVVVFFCFLYPSWSVSAKMDICKQHHSTKMFEPVSKSVAVTRKILLGKMEFQQARELLEQGVHAETACCVRA